MFVPQNAPVSLLPKKRGKEKGARYLGQDALFPSARAALYSALRQRSCDGHSVWLPAFMCRSILQPLEALKLRVRYYDVDDRLMPRLDSVETQAGDLILIAHFFGILLQLTDLANFAAQKHLTFIEDCAHILPDPAAPSQAGTTGEIAIFSLRKLLPMAYGGVLIDKTKPNDSSKPVSRTLNLGFKKKGLMLAEAIAFRAQWNLLTMKSRLRGKFGTTDNVHFSGLSACSMIAGDVFDDLLSENGLREVANRRGENYRYLCSQLAGHRDVGVPFPVLPVGSCPQVLPLIVDQPGLVAARLSGLGVEAGLWPGSEVIPMSYAGFPGTRYWQENLITVPVNQMLKTRHLDYIATSLLAACVDSVAAPPQFPPAVSATR